MCVNVNIPIDWIMMDSHAQVRCEQKCMNKPGSYVCECEHSYRLDPDGFSCTGKMWTEVCEQTWLLCVWMWDIPTDWILMDSHAQVRCEEKCVNKDSMCVNVRLPVHWIMIDSHAQVRCEEKCVNKQRFYVCECEDSYRLDHGRFACTGWTSLVHT